MFGHSTQTKTRSESHESTSKPGRLVADLDTISTEGFRFKFQGEDFDLIPVKGVDLQAIEDAYGNLQSAIKTPDIGYKDVLELTYDFLVLLCPKLSFEHVESMTLKQRNKLFEICLQYALREEIADSTEKKNT